MSTKPRRSFTFDLSNRRSSSKGRSASPASVSARSSSPASAHDGGGGGGALGWKNKLRFSLGPTTRPFSAAGVRDSNNPFGSVATTPPTPDLDLDSGPLTLGQLAQKQQAQQKPQQQQQSPQMSDFLSRESEILGGEFSTSAASAPAGPGGDDIDLDRAASAFPDIGLDGSDDIPAPVAPSSAGLGRNNSDSFVFDDFASPVQEKVTNVKVTGDDEIDRFENQFPELQTSVPVETYAPPLPQQPTFGATPTFAPRPQPSAFSQTPILHQPLADEEEPEVIKQWREKRDADIKARDEASAARRQETISKAERDIDQFYEEYSAKKERNIKENKQEEAAYLASFTDSLSAGTTWSRICDYIELRNSQSKTLARTGPGTTDLTRFKEVLLRLKREGEAAPGAAGY